MSRDKLYVLPTDHHPKIYKKCKLAYLLLVQQILNLNQLITTQTVIKAKTTFFPELGVKELSTLLWYALFALFFTLTL